MKYSLRSLMPKHRWFQFSLKAMFIVLTLGGVSLGCWNNYRYCVHKAVDHHTEACKWWLGVHFVYTGSESDESLKQRSKISETCSQHRKYHEQLEVAYKAAAWRPWERLWIDETPMETTP